MTLLVSGTVDLFGVEKDVDNKSTTTTVCIDASETEILSSERFSAEPAMTQQQQQQQQQQEPKTESQLDWSFLEEGLLFGRQSETDALQDAFKRRIDDSHSSSKPELILVSGRSGEGKTVIVQKALQEMVVTKHNGWFLRGKFDQLSSPQPYGPIVEALTQWLSCLEREESEQGKIGLDELRRQILSQVCQQGCKLMCALLPALANFLQFEEKEAAMIGGNQQHDAQQDYMLKVSTRLFRSICSTDRPLVLMMDDLQWANPSCLNVIEALVADNCPGLVVIGICRSDEVPIQHALAKMLRRLEERDTSILHVQIDGLTMKSTNEMIADVLCQSEEKCHSVAEIIYEKSNGNVFFMLHLLKTLHQGNALVKSTASNGETWLWNDEIWNNTFQSMDVVGLIAYQIRRLSNSCQNLLMTAASMGAEFEIGSLATVLNTSIENVSEILSLAINEGFLQKHQYQPNRFTFSHDRVQEAALSLIPGGTQPNLHLLIGRALLQRSSEQDLENNLFLVVDQLIRGSALLVNDVDKSGVAQLCVRAGRKASQASDFQAGLRYFDHGASLLGKRHWRDDYDLSLELYSSKAEVECCSTDFDAMDSTVAVVLANCRASKDRLRPLVTKIYSLGVRSKFQEAMKLGLAVLASLGERLPRSPRLIYLIPELLKLKKNLRSKTDDDILNLPLVDVDNKEKLAAMSVLSLMQTYAFCADVDWYPFVIIRWVQLSLKCGLCDLSSLAFASYGFLLCAMEDYDEGNRYAQLGIRLLGRCQITRIQLLPRVYFTAYGNVAPWKKAMRSTFEHLPWAISTAVDTGDFEGAMFSAWTFLLHSFAAGDRLVIVDERMEQYFFILKRCKQGPWLAMTLLLRQMLDNFIGRSEDPLALNMKMTAKANNKNDFKLYETFAMVCKLQLSYHFGNLEVALSCAKASRVVEKIIKGTFYAAYQYFYDAMTVLEAARYDHRKRGLGRARTIIKRFEKLSQVNPHNFADKLFLLRGEMESLKGNLSAALGWFEKAVLEAEKEGVIHLQAMACERSAIAYQRLGDGSREDGVKATCLIKRAVDLYDEWGAKALVTYLKAKHHLLAHQSETNVPFPQRQASETNIPGRS